MIKIKVEVPAKTTGNMTAPNMIIESHPEYQDKVTIEMRDRFPKVVVNGCDVIKAIEKCCEVEHD